MTLPLIVAGADLAPPPVLHQLVQERALRPVFNDHYLLGQFPDTPLLRARIAEYFLPTHAVVAAQSARWIYLGGTVPEVLTVLRPPHTSPLPPRINIRAIRTSYNAAAVTNIEGVPLTTKERTIVDLARWCPTEVARHEISQLLTLQVDVAEIYQLISNQGRNSVSIHELISGALAAT